MKLADTAIRNAKPADLPEIISLFTEDILGRKREDAYSLQGYKVAFSKIIMDPNQLLIVAEKAGNIVGVLQISFVYHLSFNGARRALIEGVHVSEKLRNQGIGQQMMEWAIQKAKEEGCRFIQLTSNKQRTDAHRFYTKLGFINSHEGFKLEVGSN